MNLLLSDPLVWQHFSRWHVARREPLPVRTAGWP
jgi:hypothetical protein